MRKPVVDYRQFRFSKLNDPEFSHLTPSMNSSSSPIASGIC